MWWGNQETNFVPEVRGVKKRCVPTCTWYRRIYVGCTYVEGLHASVVGEFIVLKIIILL